MTNDSGILKTSAKLTGAAIFLALIIFSSTINNFAQSIRIEEAWDDTKGNSSVCGHIENEQLTVPSYKFRVTDKNGTILKDLRTTGELYVEEGKWKKNGFFDFDPYWETVYHNIKIPITYDPKEDVYVTQEISKLSIPRRNKGWGKLRKCSDKVTKLIFSFYQNDCDSTEFIFFFPNRTVDKINLPAIEKVYNLGTIVGHSCTKNEP